MTDQTHRERQPILNLPPMVTGLLVVNLLVQLAQLVLPEQLDDRLLEAFGFVPLRYHGAAAFSWQGLLSPLTYQFLHGGFAHLGMNMLGLVAFGAGVEPRLGKLRFLIFYLLCGIAGAAAQFAVEPHSDALLIGASASISGVFGAILRFGVARQSFWFVVVLWFVMNIAAGVSGMGSDLPIAWVAHIGGFVAGLLLFPLFERGFIRR